MPTAATDGPISRAPLNIEEFSATSVDYPIIADPDKTVAELAVLEEKLKRWIAAR